MIDNPYAKKRTPSAAVHRLPRNAPPFSFSRGPGRGPRRVRNSNTGGAFAPSFNPGLQNQTETRGPTRQARMQLDQDARDQDSDPTQVQSTRASGNISKITKRLRNLVTLPFFPKISPTGMIYLSPKGKTGTDARKSRTTMTTDSEVRKHIRQHFPSYPIYKLPNPEFEALDLKGQGGCWTEKSIADAADLFYFPEHSEVVIVYPDLFNRKELRQYPQFCKLAGDGGIGVLTPCPWCKTNEFVKFKEWNVQKWKDRPRVTVGRNAESRFLIEPRMNCENIDCAGQPKAPVEDATLARQNLALEKVKNHQFGIWTKECFSAYPPEVQACYSKYLQGVGLQDDATTFAAAELIADS